MSLLRVSLRLLPLLVLSAACTGKRADPEPGGTPQNFAGVGGGGGGTSNPNGGAPSGGAPNGGAPNGGAPSTGGMGGAPGTGGMGGMAATTSTGSSGLNLAADIYPFCGCLSDAQDTLGACDNCVASSAASCAPEIADCPAPCDNIVAALRACAFDDLPCYELAYNIDSDFFDDAVALIACECGACADPVCDGTACGE